MAGGGRTKNDIGKEGSFGTEIQNVLTYSDIFWISLYIRHNDVSDVPCVKVSSTSFSFSFVANGRPWSTFISYPLLMWWATRWVIKWVDSGSTSRDSRRTCWGYNTTMAAMSESHQWQKALQIFETCRSLAAGGSFWVIADKVLNSFRLLSVNLQYRSLDADVSSHQKALQQESMTTWLSTELDHNFYFSIVFHANKFK